MADDAPSRRVGRIEAISPRCLQRECALRYSCLRYWIDIEFADTQPPSAAIAPQDHGSECHAFVALDAFDC